MTIIKGIIHAFGYLLHRYVRTPYYLRAELNKYEQLWQSKAISYYGYTIDWTTGEAPGIAKAAVRVEAGDAISEIREYPSTGKSVLVLEEINRLDTVTELFDRIHKAVMEREEAGFFELKIQYNQDFSNPAYIALRNYYRTDLLSIYAYSVVDFKVSGKEISE